MRRSTGRTRLLAAIERGDLDAVRAQVEAEPGLLDRPSWTGDTPIGKAVEVGRAEVVRWLLARGADVAQENRAGAGLMRRAAFAGATEVGRVLAEHGLPFGPAEAAGLGWATELEALIAEDPGARDLETSGGFRPLHLAAVAGQRSTAAVLVAAGAAVDPRTVNGQTPAALCVLRCPEARQVGVLEVLLEAGADADGPCGHGGERLLHHAIAARRRVLVQMLLGRGADVNRLGPAGRSPLHLAAATGSRSMVELLLAHGADRTARSRDRDETALDYARRRGLERVIPILE